MIYITGDTHNTIDMHNASAKQIRRYCGLQNVEYSDITTLIILGDFGLPWFECDVDENGIHLENKEDKYLLKWYNEKPFNILAVQGNHDNYNMIEKLPEVEMFGDRKVSDNIFYLERGHFYNIEGLSFLVLGGAKSHDKQLRKENIDWWKKEEMSYSEMNDCLANLPLHDNKVDYVLSHDGPTNGIKCLPEIKKIQERLFDFETNTTVRFNDEVDSRIEYKNWFFGHWHNDWGYDHRNESKYVPLYHERVVIQTPNPVHKIQYVIKYNYRLLQKGKLGELSEYKYIDCWDMSYEKAIKRYEQIKQELICELSMGSKEDFILEEMKILRIGLIRKKRV